MSMGIGLGSFQRQDWDPPRSQRGAPGTRAGMCWDESGISPGTGLGYPQITVGIGPEAVPGSPGIRTGIPPSVPGSSQSPCPQPEWPQDWPEQPPSGTGPGTGMRRRQRPARVRSQSREARGHQHRCIFGAGSTRPRDCSGAVQPPSPPRQARPRHSGETILTANSGGAGGAEPLSRRDP